MERSKQRRAIYVTKASNVSSPRSENGSPKIVGNPQLVRIPQSEGDT